jgi:hypothetical protein
MARSTFTQPPPAAWTRDLAGGPARGRYGIVFTPYPAASLVTTPADMGRFLASHLNGGTRAGVGSAGGPDPGGRILTPATVAEMHATQWRAQPEAPGVAYGFFEGLERGHRTLFHTGDSGDHSLVFLLPDDGVGFYLVYSGSDEQAALRERFTRAFLDRYVVALSPPFPGGAVTSWPPATTPPGSGAGSGTDQRDLAGTYRGAQYSRSNYEKLKALFLQVTVRDGGHGTLRISPPGGSAPILVRAVAPWVFHGDSGEVIAFRRGPDGRIAGFTLSGFIWDPSSWDRIGLLEDGRVHLGLMGLMLVVLLTRVMVWPVIALVRRVRRRPARLPLSAAEHRWWRWSAVASVLVLIAPVAAALTALLSFQPPVVAIPRAAGILGVLLLLAILVGLPLLPVAWLAWRRHYWTIQRRVHLTLIAVAIVTAVPLLAYWRLIGLPG